MVKARGKEYAKYRLMMEQRAGRIYEMSKQGMTYEAIGKEFDISKQMVYSIIKRINSKPLDKN